MNRLKVRLLIGLVLAVALAWGAGQGLRAATGGTPGKTTVTAATTTTASGATAAAAKTASATTAAAKGSTATTAAAPAPAPKAAQQSKGAVPQMTPQEMMQRKITPAQRKAAADALKAGRLKTAAKTAGTTLTAGATALAAATQVAFTLVPDSTGALVPDYFGISTLADGITPVPNWAFSPQPTVNTATTPWTINGGGIRKFMDSLPDLVALVAKPDTVTYPGTDYYEIELFEGSWTFHTDLASAPFTPTKLRMYRQTNNGTNTAACGGTSQPPCDASYNTLAPPPTAYLGPVILATEGRPTRIKFTNSLPAGSPNGDLFIPTDTSVMGAGTGYDPGTNSVGRYPQNRGTLHLHGGFTPWISDGTPHQWVTPPGEPGNLTTGVSTQPVPDMALPAGNSMTFYWPNQQSGRLMFYHDHAYGTTRLNVYAGEAAGYLLVDPVERQLNTTLGVQAEIPLVIQDRTFVWGARDTTLACGAPDPTATGTFATDPTWCDPIRSWGQNAGSLWFPHVYMTNQNPWDLSGANAVGRWDYALWFFPPYTGLLAHGTAPNPYAAVPGEPPEIPGTPNPSLVPEAFMDTPVVNGKAYPTLSVPAGPVRFRILNAANDRFQDLSLWVAADNTTHTTATPIPGLPGTYLCTGPTDPTVGCAGLAAGTAIFDPAAPTVLCRNSLSPNCTEVKMVPFNSSQNVFTPFPINWYTPGLTRTLDDRSGGVPDPTTRGPAMIQIGNEGGLLPQPAVVLNQPINYTLNVKNIVVLSVEQHALLLGPAERADVVVDFSAFAGHTLILYNDAPAPIPAYDQRLDYFTGGGGVDETTTGGTTMTMPGYGPNTRTIMRIQVAGSGGVGTADFVNSTMCTPAAATPTAGPVACTGPLATALSSAFRLSQDPILVPQAAYNNVYGTAVTDVPGANVSRISDTSLTFAPLDQNCLPGVATPCSVASAPTVFQMKPKAIQELFEVDYGRMNATLGVELPFTNAGNQTTVPLGYIEPATEILDTSVQILPPSGSDGTQIWKITHNGVDTHAIHVHLFNVQVINRMGWDGAIRLPDLNELGWKETVRMNPLEDIVVALRPTTPQLPFGVPNSLRLMAPALPPGTLIDTFDTTTGNPTTVPNALYNFGWEYVWHCHLLGHEENDMMRPTEFHVPTTLPDAPSPASFAALTHVVTWTDQTPFNYTTGLPTNTLGNPKNEIGFRIERSTDAVNFSPIGNAPANSTSFADTSAPASGNCTYRVIAYNATGDSIPAVTGTALCSGLPTPTVSFTGAPASAQFGATFTVTATTNAGVMPTITSTGVCTVGTVGGTPPNASAVVTMTSGTGTCSLMASWPTVSSNWSGATATQTTLAILNTTPTVTFTGAPASAVYMTSFTVTATTNASTIPTVTPTGVCTVVPVSGATPTNTQYVVTMSISGTGLCTLTATWPADANYTSMIRTQSTIALKAASTTSVGSNPNPSAVGQPVVFTFTVTGVATGALPSGSVTVTASTGETCSGTVAAGSCSIKFVTSGPRTVTASYAGDANYTASTATLAKAQAVWDFAMGVTPGSQTVNGGQKATYTVTVSPLGGFTGAVGLTCSVNQTKYSCSVAPTSVSVSGAVTATVTVTTVKNFGSTYTVTINGSYAGANGVAPLAHTVTAGLTVKK